MVNNYYKWTDEHIQELKTKAKNLDGYILYSLYCNALDELLSLAKETSVMYDNRREFEEKYRNLYNILEKVQDEINDNFQQ